MPNFYHQCPVTFSDAEETDIGGHIELIEAVLCDNISPQYGQVEGYYKFDGLLVVERWTE
jgi:hypothetical protein